MTTPRAPAAERRAAWAGPLAVWAVLVGLLFLNLGTAYAPLGSFKTVAHFAIAGATVMVIGLLFMKLGRATNLVRIAALAGVLWASFLFLLVGADYLARS